MMISWLDDRLDGGDTRLVLTAERVQEAEENLRLQGAGRPLKILGGSLSSQRGFVVTGLEYGLEPDERGRIEPYRSSVEVVRGCTRQLEVYCSVLMEDAPGKPARPWPTRLINPPRQNLDFWLGAVRQPCMLRVHWRHL